MNQHSGFREPGNESDERYEQRRGRRERGKPRRVPTCNLSKRRADHERNCGSDRDRSLPRAAKDPKNQAAEQTGVEARLRRQTGKRRVTQSCRKQIRGKRDAGEKIQAKPTKTIIA